MLTHMLFDVVAITGLFPYDGNFDHNEQDKKNIEFDSNRVGFTRYIEDITSLIPLKSLLKNILPFWLCGSLDACSDVNP